MNQSFYRNKQIKYVMKTIKTTVILTLLILFQNGIQAQKLRNKIVKSIAQIEESYPLIKEDRKIVLDQLASRIFKANGNDENATVVFIDRHNKEKSQLAAIWLRTGLLHYGLKGYNVLSAGTEIVREPLPALASLEEYGFRVSNASGSQLFSYNVKSGSETWAVKYKEIESLNLDDDAIKIFTEPGLVPEDGPRQIEITLASLDTIAKEMLYIASMIDYLNEKTTTKYY